MLTLAWPWMLVLLPLPWLYRAIARPAPISAPALRARHFLRLAGGVPRSANPVDNRVRLVLLTILWLALLTSAARPTWVGEPVALTATGRDLMLAIDLSDSMRINDMRRGDAMLSRMAVLREVLGDFIGRRQGDRVGLILFGSEAYLQAPLTFDLRTVQSFVDEMRIGFAGLSTAIGDAIIIATRRLEDQAADSKVLILLSDGADTSSEIHPLAAAEIAARHGVRIHTIGLGATEMISGGRRVNPSWDLDENTLQAVADITGGRYFRAHDPQELVDIYATLDAIEPVDQEGDTVRPLRDLFHWPLGVALLAWLLLLGHHPWRGNHD